MLGKPSLAAEAVDGPEPPPHRRCGTWDVTGTIAHKANTQGTSGAVLCVVPWVPLQKAAALADAAPGRGAGRSQLLTAPATRWEGAPGRKGWKQQLSSLLTTLPPFFPVQGPRKGIYNPQHNRNHAQPLCGPWSSLCHQVYTPCRPPHKWSQHPTTPRLSRRAPTCSTAVRANSLPDPLILQLAAAKTGGWESHRASRATFLPCRRLLDVPGHPHAPLPPPAAMGRPNEAASLSQRSPMRVDQLMCIQALNSA